MIPTPSDPDAPVGVLVAELTDHLGIPATVALACDLLGGADPSAYRREIVYLTGHLQPHDGWADCWPRVWGARASLYLWEESAGDAVVQGLVDDAWRMAEMCLKVSIRRDVPSAAARALDLLTIRLDLTDP